MTVIKRFHDCLLPTHGKVVEAAEEYKNFAVKDGFLREASGYPFYNTSKFTFETLKADPANIEDNFKGLPQRFFRKRARHFGAHGFLPPVLSA